MAHYSEYTQYAESFGINARAGLFCRGSRCGGWISSELDHWEKCMCWSGQTHPEVAMYEAELEAESDAATFEADELPYRLESPRPWHPVAIPDPDGIPF